jgi:molybdenum cofactor cytidylyltransferase
MAKIPHLLLTAGDSHRMGQPKQLLLWGNKTLIEHQIQIRLQTGNEVIVVLGSHAKEILPVIENLPVTVLVNNEWAEGMGSTLAYGIKMLSKKFEMADGVLVSLVDQPLVTTSYLEKMLNSFQPGYRQIIVSSSDSGWKGVPVLFDRYYFEELKQINGKDGARKVINRHLKVVKYIDGGNLLEDIDTPDAYRQLFSTHKRHQP